MGFKEYLGEMFRMIDNLKAMSSSLGLSNTGDEYKIISELFTYKFLNDKLLYEFNNRDDLSETLEGFVECAGVGSINMKAAYLIENLFEVRSNPNFHEIFDSALICFNKMNNNIFNLKTSSGKIKPLFEPLSVYIRDDGKELELAKRAISILYQHNFSDIYAGGFDYFSSIFEYLIKDYNKDSGKYGEYFTPLFAANIIGDILFNDTPVFNVTVYDPCAGSGTLLLALANKIGIDRCTVHSQDISQKSTQFLRINLILNELVHSLHNVFEGNTLTNPQHLKGNDLIKFDFIVSNPPFKTDFSNSIESLKSDKYNRFFAGLPNIPKKDKNKMAIYETFLQHVIASLSLRGKAALVVPTGFVSASNRISLKIRKHLVDNNWLRGVIHMPSHIFATTDTSVSLIFIDKAKVDDKVMLIDASNLGAKVSLEDGQRTILNDEEKYKITSFFKERKVVPEFSVLVANKQLQENGYNVHAGQYIELKDEELGFDIDDRLLELKIKLIDTMDKSSNLDNLIREALKVI